MQAGVASTPGAAPHLIEFTEEKRQELLGLARDSLFFFGRGILGYKKLDDFQWEICQFLQGDAPYGRWLRGMVCAYRGSIKSTCTSQMFPLWRGLFRDTGCRGYPKADSFSAKLIENTDDNARVNHFEPLVETITEGPRAGMFQWLFSHMIPEGFAGTNSHQLSLRQDNPLAKPTLTYWGVDASFEGWHGQLVILDDPEGADAIKSKARNDDSYRAYGRCVPLLEEPVSDQILIVLTPWGDQPLAHRLRDRELKLPKERRAFVFFWRPLLKKNGQPEEPKRFPPHVIEMLRTDREIWESQYLLQKPNAAADIFQLDSARRYAFEWADGASRQVIRYPTISFDPEKLDEGLDPIQREIAHVRVKDLRTFIHADSKHKLDSAMRTKSTRPSRHALVVSGVAPDSHAFPLELWEGDPESDPGEMARVLISLAHKWEASEITFESIGYQYWFKQWVETIERNQINAIHRMVAAGRMRQEDARLRRSVSGRMIEAEKTNESKEWIYRERLSPWVNHGVLHFHLIDHHRLIHQMGNLTNESEEIDLVDCLSQGASVWKPPVDGFLHDRFRRQRKYVEQFVRDPLTGISRPWSRPASMSSLICNR